MAMNDPISDMLTRIRNALSAGHTSLDVPASRLKEQMLGVMKREGFIRDYVVVDSGPHARLRVELKYLDDRSSVIKGLRRVSKPSLRTYSRYREVRPVRSGLGISILSTSKGVITGKQARDEKVGGEVLCEVW